MRLLLKIIALPLSLATFQSCINESYEPTLDARPVFELHPGDTLPHFSIKMSNGETISTCDLKGKQTFILFFSTRCPDCRHFLPVMQQFHESCPDAYIIAVSRDESSQSVMDYWNSNGFSIPCSPQSDQTIYRLFASTGVPRLFISDPEQTITHAFSPENLPDCMSLIRIATSDQESVL